MRGNRGRSDRTNVEIAIDHESRTSLEDQIAKNLSQFTRGQKQVAAYILGHPHEAAFQSMSQLAQAVGVSNAAMTRFLKAAGFANGDELKSAVGRHLTDKMGLAHRLGRRLKDVETTNDFFASVVNLELEYIQNCVRDVHSALIEKAGEIISLKDRVFIWSQRPYRGLVDLLDYRLTRLSKQVVPIMETGHYILDHAHQLGPNDVIIGLAFLRSPADLEMLFDVGREKGSQLVLLTDLPLIPRKLSADVVLSAQRGPAAVSNSHTVPMVIINAMVLAVGTKLAASGYPVLQELDALRKRYGKEYGYGPLTSLRSQNERQVGEFGSPSPGCQVERH